MNNTVVNSVKAAIKKTVRMARDAREASRALEREQGRLGINSVTIRQEGAFQLQVWFKMSGDDTIYDTRCPCDPRHHDLMPE